jgi:hypothetical protein
MESDTEHGYFDIAKGRIDYAGTKLDHLPIACDVPEPFSQRTLFD